MICEMEGQGVNTPRMLLTHPYESHMLYVGSIASVGSLFVTTIQKGTLLVSWCLVSLVARLNTEECTSLNLPRTVCHPLAWLGDRPKAGLQDRFNEKTLRLEGSRQEAVENSLYLVQQDAV